MKMWARPLEVWSLGQQQLHTAWDLCRMLGPTPELLNQNLHLNKISRHLGSTYNSVMALIPLLAAQHHDGGNACALVTRRKETSAPVLRLVTEYPRCFPLITYYQPCLLLGLLWGPNGVLANKAGRDLGPACLSDLIWYHFPSCSLHSSHTDSRQSSFLLQGLCTGCFLCLECSSFWSLCIWLLLGYSDPSLIQWDSLNSVRTSQTTQSSHSPVSQPVQILCQALTTMWAGTLIILLWVGVSVPWTVPVTLNAQYIFVRWMAKEGESTLEKNVVLYEIKNA